MCWAFACKALFQLRLLSFQRLYLSFYSNVALVVLFCTIWCGVRDELAQQFSSCRERLQPDCRSECVAVAEFARRNSENVESEKKRNSLKISGDRLHAVT